jgi:hypothetical protein
MSHPTACIRCKGIELVEATFADTGIPRLVVDADHSSPVTARVCVACGAVLLTASEPGALRAGLEPEREVQEFDF